MRKHWETLRRYWGRRAREPVRRGIRRASLCPPGESYCLENGKGVNLEHALRVMDGLGLTMLVVPKAHAP